MIFGIFATLGFVLALVVLYFGVRVSGRFVWIVDWLRGTLFFVFVALAVLLVLGSIDLLSYKELRRDKPLLTVSIEKLAEQQFQVKLLNIESGSEESFELFGDQWQVDARIIRWQGIVDIFGAKPGYRLDRLSGRYYSLEDERRKSRSVHTLEASDFGLDLWAFVREYGRFLPLFDAVYGSATYLPMEDGAIFQVALGATGLVAKPMNAIAESSISRWE